MSGWATPASLESRVARGVLVAAPVLGFGALDLPGLVTSALVLPLAVAGAAYARSSGRPFPGWECALLAVLALSVLWGDLPAYSVERLRTYLPLLLATVVACTLLSGRAIVACLRVAFAVIIGSSLVSLLLDPAGRVREGSTELVLHAQFVKNDYGGLLAFSVLLVLSRPRRANVYLVPLLVVLLALNKSVTAWVVSVILGLTALSIRYLATHRNPRVSRVSLVALLLSLTGGTVVALLTVSESALASVGKDPSLGSRTETWAASWQSIRDAPLLGHGAFTFLNAPSDSPVTRAIWAMSGSYKPPHPHNALLDLWGQVGLLGVCVFIGMLVVALRHAARTAGLAPEVLVTAPLGLLFVLVFGLTEPTFLGPWLVVTLMCVAALRADALPTWSGSVAPATAERAAPGGLLEGPPRPRLELT